MADFTTNDGQVAATATTPTTVVGKLIQLRANILANLAEETENPKPSYSIDGESVDWNTWAVAQQKRLEDLTRMIVKLSPYIIRTRQVL